MHNRSLKIAVVIDPPAATSCALDRICPNRGIVYELTEIMCTRLNFTCTFVPATSNTYGRYENGQATGAIYDIVTGQADTSLPRFTPTEQRAQVVDFSSAYFYENYLLVTRKPEPGPFTNKLDLVHAFGPYVWTCIAIVMILAACIMSTTIMFKREFCLINTLIKTKFPGLHFNGKLCVWTISAAALILTRSYTGYLFTKHVSAFTEKPFENLETFATCVQEKRCTLAIKTGSLSYVNQLIDTNGSKPFSLLKSALEKNPMQNYSIDNLINRILDEKGSYYTSFLWDTDFYYATEKIDACKFYVISAALLPGPNTFPIPKNWPFRQEMDNLAAQINEFGYIKNIMARYKVREKNSCVEVVSAEGDSLGLLIELFLFLAIGEGLGLVWLFLETAWMKWDSRTERMMILV